MRPTAAELGKAGERHALELLKQRGYAARLLPVNAPTYDIEASRNGISFLVSVKVSRSKEHVRLGKRNAVERLVPGNFLFAFLPPPDRALHAFTAGKYRLLIVPAEVARKDSLCVHDAYWAERGGDKGFSVMVKGYGSHHRDIWPRWLSYADAWHLLP